jgi:exodeoxyribonuclease VII small subunit
MDKPAPRKERFEDHLKALEEAVKALESGQLGLEEAMEKYELGRAALARCFEILEQAEKKIEQLVRKPDGSLGTKPLEPATERPAAPPKKKKSDDELPF